MDIVLSQNSPEIRQVLTEKYGLKLCICCSFIDACWLHYNERLKEIHGVGYWDETFEVPGQTMTQEKMLKFFIDESSKPVLIFKDVNEFARYILESYPLK